MLNKFLLLISAFLIFISFGCTSSQKATEYPQRYIDQPYTLPDDVDVWGSVGSVFYERINGEVYSWPYPIPIPLYWEHSLNENLTLEIPVIPIGLRWKISSDANSELGLRFLWVLDMANHPAFLSFLKFHYFIKFYRVRIVPLSYHQVLALRSMEEMVVKAIPTEKFLLDILFN